MSGQRRTSLTDVVVLVSGGFCAMDLVVQHAWLQIGAAVVVGLALGFGQRWIDRRRARLRLRNGSWTLNDYRRYLGEPPLETGESE